MASLLLCAMPTRARAAFIINIEQDGSNVDATGSGSFNLAALTLNTYGGDYAEVDGIYSTATLGPAIPGTTVDYYETLTGPSSFGSSIDTAATSGSGPIAGLYNSELLVVPHGYLSGTPITNSATFDNTTIAELGLTDGTYTFSWGGGLTADDVVVNIGPVSAVPEPMSVGMLGIGGATLLLRRRRRQA